MDTNAKLQDIKVFCFFFSKKKILLFLKKKKQKDFCFFKCALPWRASG